MRTTKKTPHHRLNQCILLVLATMLIVPTTTIAGDERTMKRLEAQRQARFNLVKAVQKTLLDKNYNPGPADGLMGPKTISALKAYQKDNELMADGNITPATLKSLGLTD